jgi:hypothetical protein
MHSKSAFYLITLVSFILYACTQILGSGQSNPVDYEVLKSGLHSGYPVDGDVQMVISSKAQFEGEWEKIFSHSTNKPEKPTVNFNSEKVILIMLEDKPTGGFGIDGLEVNKSGDKVVVSYHEVHPGDRCGTYQAITRPYKLISIPNTAEEVQIYKGKTIVSDCR